jgi:hypothetical protein
MADQDNRPLIFIVDTSSWLDIERQTAQNRILSALVPVIEAGRIKVPPEVWDEIEESSKLFEWLSTYRGRIVENRRAKPDYLMLAGKIAHSFQGMAGVRGRRNKADPWVVATAVHARSNPHVRVVVCNETVRRRPNRKMPTACKAYGIECLSLFEMLDREYPDDGWLK